MFHADIQREDGNTLTMTPTECLTRDRAGLINEAIYQKRCFLRFFTTFRRHDTNRTDEPEVGEVLVSHCLAPSASKTCVVWQV